MSNVVLEALASGLPVVATAVGGMSALVEPGENGETVPVNDVPATVAALVGLVEDRGRREAFGRRARACAEALSWDRCARRYAQMVAEVAAAGKVA
jgi:glycosyltransferase involved in cell wall biosynthesis